MLTMLLMTGLLNHPTIVGESVRAGLESPSRRGRTPSAVSSDSLARMNGWAARAVKMLCAARIAAMAAENRSGATTAPSIPAVGRCPLAKQGTIAKPWSMKCNRASQ
jgi:hypothetical protein